MRIMQELQSLGRLSALVLAGVLVACGDGAGEPSEVPAEPAVAVERAADHCLSHPERFGDPAALTGCLVETVAEACEASADCTDETILVPALVEAVSGFCLVDPVVTELLPTLDHCLRTGFAWGCPPLSRYQSQVADCLVEQVGILCELPGSDRFPPCQRRNPVAALAPDARLALLAPLSEVLGKGCGEDAPSDCLEQGLSAFCVASSGGLDLPFCVGGVLTLPAVLPPPLSGSLCAVPGLSALLRSACEG